MATVKFNSKIPEYAFLSAFYPGPFIAPLGKKMVLFPHREAYYQAHKTKDQEQVAKIVNSLDGSRAKYFGSAKGGARIIDNFDSKRKDIVREGIRYQMTQNAVLRALLHSTGSAKIKEEAYWDDYFGTGRDGKGKNVHGKLLVEYRDEGIPEDEQEKYKPKAKYKTLHFYPIIKAERND